MLLFVNFDIVLIVIFITIFITGYIRGGGIELLRVLKVIIPFFVLYFYGGEITHLLFSSPKTVEFVYAILPNIPYRNTIAALSTQIGVYLVVYFLLAIFLWRLGKYVLDERIEYLFGRLNSILGGLFSVIRMYVIISVFIIPFYALNFTNNNDVFTSFILDNPPSFSKIGRLIEKSKPTLDKLNELSASLKIMDMESLNKYTALLNDVKIFVESSEEDAFRIYEYVKTHYIFLETFTNKQEFLKYYIDNTDYFSLLIIEDKAINQLNQQLLTNAKDYKEVYVWSYNNDIKELKSLDDIVNSFVTNYPYLSAKANDQLTIDILAKIKLQTQIYTSVKNWLIESYSIQYTNDFDLLSDENLELILTHFHLHKQTLIESIKAIDANEEEIQTVINQIERLARFQTEYLITYKPLIEEYNVLLEDVSFKYKLVFSIMKEKELNQVVEENDKDPIVYLLALDTLDFINYFNQDESVYFQAGQVYVSLFLVNYEEDDGSLIPIKITYDDLMRSLRPFTSNPTLLNQIKIDINLIFKSLLLERNQESYLEYLINNGYADISLLEDMLQSSELKEILNYENYILIKVLYESMSG